MIGQNGKVQLNIFNRFTASKTADFIASVIEKYIRVTIISEKTEEIRLAIIEEI